MATRVRVVAYVPAAAREACERLVEPYLQSPNDHGVSTFGVALVPLAGADDAEPTHYGCSAVFDDDSGIARALQGLQGAVPGSAYTLISPFRTFDFPLHWTGWLAAGSLKVRQEVVVSP